MQHWHTVKYVTKQFPSLYRTYWSLNMLNKVPRPIMIVISSVFQVEITDGDELSRTRSTPDLRRFLTPKPHQTLQAQMHQSTLFYCPLHTTWEFLEFLKTKLFFKYACFILTQTKFIWHAIIHFKLGYSGVFNAFTILCHHHL